ncbi:MAG: calcium:proton antiporter [Cyclobacteriaceae bacterium]|jgi:Ca2+:H+ antiporter
MLAEKKYILSGTAVFAVAIASFFIHHAIFNLVMVGALVYGVVQAVHHADVIAKRIGEPFGAVVLAIAVTVIEVSIIVALMFQSGHGNAGLARDTVFAAVMIILTAMTGLAILVGSLKFHEQQFSLQGTKSALTVLVAISVLSFILPNFTATTPGPFYSHSQLIFVAIVTLTLYGSFLFVQNFSHRQDFASGSETPIHQRPSRKAFLVSSVLLPLTLIAIVLLAEHLAPVLESFIQRAGAPKEVAGLVIASVILLPEGISALKAARKNQLQTSLNLSLGSALASIGLTIPVVSAVSIVTNLPLALGINSEAMILFMLALVINVLALSTGRTSILQGIVLLVVFMVYLLTVFIP